MAEKTRIGIICDMHLPDDKASPQYAFLKYAAEQMKKDKVDIVICLGDISSFGEVGAVELYLDVLRDFEHYEVAGNSDVRNAATREVILERIPSADFYVGSRHVIGINTQDEIISVEDRVRLSEVKAGDIIFMHHYIQSMQEESGQWLTELAENVPLIILHGHGHRIFDHYIHDSHVIGMRGLDPDKARGNFPSIHYLDVSEENVCIEEHLLKLPKSYMNDTSKFFGLSCVNNAKDVAFAIEHAIKYVELRCNGIGWKPDMELLPVLEKWRQETEGYLSIHMPNLYYKDGNIYGVEQWLEALKYANVVNADSLTIHPPRVRVGDMKPEGEVWNAFLELYLKVARGISQNTRIGIENLHKGSTEQLDDTRGFGYRPEEVSAWIDAINTALGMNRVGHVLDVGHARNNGLFASMYPSSKWYRIMGNKTIAYHIHQVLPTPQGVVNHNAIENWFGPDINYTSFFYAWHENMLNHVPVFLEVGGSENYAKSIAAFESMMEKL